MSEEPHVIARVDGQVGRITLNRPKALNALSGAMVAYLFKALNEWADDPRVDLILMDSATERAFSSGGDIREIYEAGVTGDFETPRQYWRDEYLLDLLIAEYPKPVVVIMNGLVMGGGVGLSAHAAHRVVTQSTTVAMPECAIGLVPDVGSASILAVAPGSLGEYIALTGVRLDAADAIYSGFADVLVPAEAIEDLKRALIGTADIAIIGQFSQTRDKGTLERCEAEITRIFSLPSVPAIVDALNALSADWAVAALKNIQAGAPLALEAALLSVRAARQNPGLRHALVNDFRCVSRCLTEGEFLEGIRAAVIDKDGRPQWKHPRHEDLPAGLAKAMLRPLASDLVLEAAKSGEVAQ